MEAEKTKLLGKDDVARFKKVFLPAQHVAGFTAVQSCDSRDLNKKQLSLFFVSTLLKGK
jgi:hypothetical protein